MGELDSKTAIGSTDSEISVQYEPPRVLDLGELGEQAWGAGPLGTCTSPGNSPGRPGTCVNPGNSPL